MNRRNFVTFVTAWLMACGLAAAPQAQADTYPSQPITLIVAWPAGGGSDVAMRLVADTLSKRVNVPVVVLNKPGAGGSIGHREIANAKPDGYTIGMYSSGGLSAQYLNPQANTIEDFQPLAFFGDEPGTLQVNPATGITSVKEYVERARANPGKLRNGNDQPGGSSFVTIALYEKLLNIKVTRVPYPGYAPTVLALLSGEIDSGTVPIPDTIEHHKAGKIKIIGVSVKERHFQAPDVPTFKEQGFDVLVSSWRSIIAPKGIPEDRLRFLETNIMAVLSDPEFQARARQSGFGVTPMDSKATHERWKADDQILYPVLLEAGLVKTRQK